MAKVLLRYNRYPTSSGVKELTYRRKMRPWRLPIRQPTERELATVPLKFRCYFCGKPTPKRDFGGYLLKQRMCKRCRPYLESVDVGSQIRWDERRGYTTYIRE